MSMVKLKVCGMKEQDNILEIAAYRPDYMGFIFFRKSPRFVGEQFQIPEALEPAIKRVGVFVNESVENMIAHSLKHQLDFIQLHGDESSGTCRVLKDNKLGVIKVFGIDNVFDFESIKPFESFVDYFLFDYKGELHGGNGIPFDWNVLKQYESDVPFFLSGGISPDNVMEVQDLSHQKLYAIDVNSGIEDKPGIKSKNKLEALLSKI